MAKERFRAQYHDSNFTKALFLGLSNRDSVYTHCQISFPKDTLQLTRNGLYITFLYAEGYLLVGYFASIHGVESSLRT
jgi:hypothetical protein